MPLSPLVFTFSQRVILPTPNKFLLHPTYLKKYNFTPFTFTNMVIYITIINGVCKDKLVSEACDLYCVMAVKEISADVVTYNSLIYGLCIVGKLKEATSFLNEMVLKAIVFVPIIYWLMHYVKKER